MGSAVLETLGDVVRHRKRGTLQLVLQAPAAGPVLSFGHAVDPFGQTHGLLPGGNVLESGIGHGMLSLDWYAFGRA